MSTPKIFESEYRFCLILWEYEPIKSSELVKLCKDKLVPRKPRGGTGGGNRRNGEKNLRRLFTCVYSGVYKAPQALRAGN